MKVKISNNNAPRPAGLSDAVSGGLIGGASNLLGSSIDAIAGAVQAKKQREHDKEMAALNQQNILAQMEQANKYQVEQWDRENAYNDPTAVAERYRKAGINPRSAFGTGSASGSGIAGGLSGAPSGSSTGSSSNAMFSTNFAGLGADIIGGARLGAQNMRDSADAQKAKEEAVGLAIDNKTKEQKNLNELNKQLVEINKVLADTDLSKEQKSNYIKQREFISQQIRESEQNVRSSQQGVEESKQRVSESKQRISESEKRVEKMDVEKDLYRVQMLYLHSKVDNTEMDTALKQAQKGHYSKLAEQIDKQIDYMVSNIDLNKAQIKYIEKKKSQIANQIALSWSQHRHRVALDNKNQKLKEEYIVSSETRRWLGTVLSLGFGDSPSGGSDVSFDTGDTNFYPMFAD